MAMKTIRPLTLSLGLAFLLGALTACGGLPLLGRTEKPIQPIESPAGDRVLAIGVNQDRDDPTQYLTLVFEVRGKASGDLLHRQQTRASSRMAWSMRWLDNRTVQLSSSDVGTTCWQEQDDGAWPELPCP